MDGSKRKGALVALAMGLLAGATLGLDLWTKHLARVHLVHGAHVVVQGFFQLVHTENPGASFSMLRDAPRLVRLPLLVTLTVLALGAIVAVARRPAELAGTTRVGLALVAGGALGNLIDRVQHGSVTDFFDVFLRVRGVARHWPIFNVADIAICFGVLLLFQLGRARRVPEEAPPVVTTT